MAKRRKTVQNSVSQQKTDYRNKDENREGFWEFDPEREERINIVSCGLIELLNPIEPNIMYVQSVLIWEKPLNSLGLLAVVSLFFWLTTVLRIYFVIGATGFLVLFLHSWFSFIWPEIRVPPIEGEGADQWTPVYPHLLSVPEISRHLAAVWVTLNNFMETLIRLRKLDHARFFLWVTPALACLAVFGCFISGTMICYFTTISLLLTPAVVHHNLHRAATDWFMTRLFKLEEKMSIRRRSFRGHRGRRPVNEALQMTEDFDTSDEEIQEFFPGPSESSAYLARGVEASNYDDDDDDDTINNLLTPPSADLEGSSREDSDAEDEFSLDERDMPSVDDLDSMTTFSLPPNAFDFTTASGLVESNFSIISNQIHEPSEESNEDKLGEGLVFPDVQELEGKENYEEDSRITGAKRFVTDIFSGTISGLSKFRQTLQLDVSPDSVDVKPIEIKTGELDNPFSEDVLEEFEFLNKEELDNFDEGLANK